MKDRNCPNCGAPIEIERCKCAYCGTSYYDFSCIPLREPFFLKLNLGSKDDPKIITTQAMMTQCAMMTSPDQVPEIELKFAAIPFRVSFYETERKVFAIYDSDNQ